MPPPRRPRSILSLVLLLGLLVTGGAGAVEESVDGWWRLSDGNLALESNGSSDQARRLLTLLASLREAMARLAFGEAKDLRVPTTVVLFADAASYEPFRIYQRDGQFLTTPFESLVVVNAAAGRRPIERIAAHEYLHVLLAAAGLDLPLWLDEGLAEYYSTARVEDGLLVLGGSAREHRLRLLDRPFLPFDELAAVSPTSPSYLDEGAAERFYAQSWLLVHFLVSRPGGAEDLTELVRRLGAGEATETALESSLGYGAAELDLRLRSYLERGGMPEVAMPLSERAPRWVGGALRPVQVVTRMALLATEQLRWRDSPDRIATAQQWVARMLAEEPLDGDRLAVAARLQETLGRRPEAAALYARSLALGAREGRTFAYYARFLLDEIRSGQTDQELLSRADGAIARALETAPSHPWLLSLQRELTAAARGGAAGEGSHSVR